MKIFALEYTGYKFDQSFNLGDDIQTLAACGQLPRVDGYVSREALNAVNEPCIVSLNGFFMGSPNWPPSRFVVPILFSFHISPKYRSIICSPEGLAYLKEFEPVGCRDLGTVAILKEHGVDAFYSKCLTLTFERRKSEPTEKKTFIVGVNKQISSIIPQAIKDKALFVNQSKIQLPFVPSHTKMALASHLLDVYRRQATLVITSKIHCAMPCIAMGIPVVFLYDDRKKDDYRVSIIKDLVGINYVSESLLARGGLNALRSNKINWSPEAIDIESEKSLIMNQFGEALGRAQDHYSKRFS